MSYIDTHCHTQDPEYADAEAAYQRAREAGVNKMICVGADVATSAHAVDFAAAHDGVWASVGVHPHDAKDEVERQEVEDLLHRKHSRKIVAIGECGLDYFYTNSPREQQIAALHWQLALAQEYDVPVIFHVREAFADFWPLFDQYAGIRGVLHSFTDSLANMEKGLERGLYVGVNGISTFTKDEAQKKMFRSIPLESMVLETDSPFLTPVPKRGKINEPAFVAYVVRHVARERNISEDMVAVQTTANAETLFAI